MKKYLLNLFFLFACLALFAQSPQDSITIANLKWQMHPVSNGVLLKSVMIDSLYDGPQSINIIEVDTKVKNNKFDLEISNPTKLISEEAPKVKAVAAINGSFFDIKNSNSVCFLKVGKDVIDTTIAFQGKFPMNAAIMLKNGKLSLNPWSRSIEKSYTGTEGKVLVSGPMLLYNDTIQDFKSFRKDFIERKHPRTAIGITPEGKVLLITFDGRFPEEAIGVSIPELGHFLKMLGANHAVNLDGGGSTTLWLATAPDNGVVNYPSDNKKFDHFGARQVANFFYLINDNR